MKKLSIIVLLVGITTFSYSQTFEGQIIGNWNLVKKDNGINSDIQLIPISGNKSAKQSETVLSFYKNNKIDYLQSNQTVSTIYAITDSVLIIGDGKYIINKLTKDSLIIKDFENALPMTYFYERIKNATDY